MPVKVPEALRHLLGEVFCLSAHPVFFRRLMHAFAPFLWARDGHHVLARNATELDIFRCKDRNATEFSQLHKLDILYIFS